MKFGMLFSASTSEIGLSGTKKTMIADGIEYEHLAKAIDEIERNGIPSRRTSKFYFYVHSGKRYPPKYVVGLAAKFAFGKELPYNVFNAVRARAYLLARGHDVVDVRDENSSILVDENDESAFPEGQKKFQLHQVRERDTRLAVKAKAIRLAETGVLECDECGFDFSATYGQIGEGYIEAHHTVPISTLSGEHNTKISELALVCSNCHRMFHRQRATLSVQQLRANLRTKPK